MARRKLFNRCTFCGEEIRYADIHLGCSPEADGLVNSLLKSKNEKIKELQAEVKKLRRKLECSEST